jgi:DNA-binding MarR family transcriptional regulator
MHEDKSSSDFTTTAEAAPVGPPMIGALMRLPWEAVTRRMLRALHENGFDDIDGPQLTVLLWPGPDGMRPSDLAARMKVTKQALNYLLGDLERRGYLERRPDPDDRRARRIALTERGRALVPVIRAAISQTEREWGASLGEARFAQLRELLVELNEIAARDAPADAPG